MRGTLALIGIVLLLVVAAHVQRENADAVEDAAAHAAAVDATACHSPCAVAAADSLGEDSSQ